MNRAAKNHNKSQVQPFLFEYFNVINFSNPLNLAVHRTATRVVNSLIEALNTRDHLPRLIVVTLDKDIIADCDVFDDNVVKIICETTEWLVKQCSICVQCKHLQILDKKPRAIYGDHPRIIYVRMIRRVDHFRRGSRLDEMYALHAKFNESLNNAAAHTDQHILTINACVTSSHFDHFGNLSAKGKRAFWNKMDGLLECFD